MVRPAWQDAVYLRSMTTTALHLCIYLASSLTEYHRQTDSSSLITHVMSNVEGHNAIVVDTRRSHAGNLLGHAYSSKRK